MKSNFPIYGGNGYTGELITRFAEGVEPATSKHGVLNDDIRGHYAKPN